jgi:hypothetical protein
MPAPTITIFKFATKSPESGVARMLSNIPICYLLSGKIEDLDLALLFSTEEE